jgi:alkylation response protein AidB-like acyl-CoA dehydrogenase
MDLKVTPEYDEYRAGVKRFLADHHTSQSRSLTANRKWLERFLRAAIEAGYVWRNVPRQYGGAERPFDPLEATIIQEEFARVRAPSAPLGAGKLVIPALLSHGTEEQKQRFIAPTLVGELIWCQGFSEPGAGSDLASVNTGAVVVGDNWIVNGHKIWTSYAHLADYMFALVRTEPDAPKHRAISYLLIEMKQPGIEVRPLRQMTGEANFNEVFLTDVLTPLSHTVGERGKGWQVKSATLTVERTGSAGAPSMALFDRVLALARIAVRHGKPALEDPEVRQWLANLEACALAHLYSGYRMFTKELKGESAGLFPMMNKLYSTEFFGMEAARIARELMGDEGLLLPPARGEVDGSSLRDRPVGKETWNGTALTLLSNVIAGGTSNIQRNVIAERGYGLPREGRLVEDT